MPIRLQAREKAPDFQVDDLFGNALSLHANRGSLVLLSFYRDSSNALQDLHHRIDQILKHYPRNGNTFRFLGVFETGQEQLHNYYTAGNCKLPFSIIADPNAKLFKLYRVNLSWWQNLSMSLNQRTVSKYIIANNYAAGAVQITHNSPNYVSADFLIMADGKIEIAYYGSSASDHLPFSVIDEYFGGTKVGK